VLAGKHLLVTGGTLGIGYACALKALEEGADVTLCARTPSAVTAALEALERRFGAGRVQGMRADVGSQTDVESLFERTARHKPLDGVIHAAAVLPPIGSILDVEPDEWFDTVRINLFGAFLVTRTACRTMRPRGGRIVLFSGGGASGPFPNYTAYACSKVAVVRLVETVAQEMQPYGIEINALAPGFVVTRMHAQTIGAGSASGEAYLDRTKQEVERGGVPPGIPASCAAFLVSDRARGISGRFISAVHDRWEDLPEHASAIEGTDIFTLRRIVPADRGVTI